MSGAAYRIVDRENVTINGEPWTMFSFLDRQPHRVQGACYVFAGRYAVQGHDATDHECMRVAVAALSGDDDRGVTP